MVRLPCEESPLDPPHDHHHAAPPRWRVWWLACRPATLPAGLMPVVVGSALAASDGGFHWQAAVSALFGALFIQIGTNLFNDYADFHKGADTAERLGPARATQRGWLTPRQVLTGSAVAFAAATLCGLYLVWRGGWPVLVLGLMSLLCGVAYTGGPWPLAYVGLGELFVLAFFGVAAVAGTTYVQTLAWDGRTAMAGLALGCLATAILVVNNLRDVRTDARAGKRTLVVRLGLSFGRWEYGLLVGLAYGAVLLVWLGGWGSTGWLWPLATMPWGAMLLVRVARRDGAALNPLLGQTGQLEMAFALLLGAGVLLCR